MRGDLLYILQAKPIGLLYFCYVLVAFYLGFILDEIKNNFRNFRFKVYIYQKLGVCKIFIFIFFVLFIIYCLFQDETLFGSPQRTRPRQSRGEDELLITRQKSPKTKGIYHSLNKINHIL